MKEFKAVADEQLKRLNEVIEKQLNEIKSVTDYLIQDIEGQVSKVTNLSHVSGKELTELQALSVCNILYSLRAIRVQLELISNTIEPSLVVKRAKYIAYLVQLETLILKFIYLPNYRDPKMVYIPNMKDPNVLGINLEKLKGFNKIASSFLDYISKE